jgi:hypothetical protein
LRRPALARLLDFEEARLPMTKEVHYVRDVICVALEAMLTSRHTSPLADMTTIAQDIVAIVKGMIDAAGERNERDPQALESRVAYAVFGYLEVSSRPASAKSA